MEGSLMEKRNRVVIVGGGIAGALLAKLIQFHADVVLIDPKEYFEIPWANLRAKVEPSVAERSVIYHTDYFTNGKVVISSAVGVTETEVLTSDGRIVFYDYLVIATGQTSTSPRIREDRLERFQEDNQKITTSNSILIVGGGPTGVELAGEIAMEYPEKKVTLVHNGLRLLEFIGPKASNKSLNWLATKNIEVLLNQSIDVNTISETDKLYTTSAGNVITADCCFLCVGKPVSSSWLKDSTLKEYLDRNGRLMVDANLRVGGHKNVFAIGDITDIPEIKQGFLAQKHALVVARNLKLLLNGGKKTKMAKYRSSPPVAIVSLGRKDAVAQFSIATVIGFIPGMVKSRDLFVGKTRRLMGLERTIA